MVRSCSGIKIAIEHVLLALQLLTRLQFEILESRFMDSLVGSFHETFLCQIFVRNESFYLFHLVDWVPSSSLISFGDLVPVDNLPDLFHIVGPNVKVVEVVGVLPDVDGEEWNQVSTLIDKSILIGSCSKLELSRVLVVSQPSPAGTLDGSGVGAEVRDEVIEGAKRVVDGISERGTSSGRNTTFANWGERLPEEFVVEMASAIKFNSLGQINILLVVTISQGLGGLLLKVVKIVHVSLMFLSVVELHKLLRNDRLKTVETIRQRLQDSLLEGGEFLMSGSLALI